jgi:DNA-binding NarL/FixJ family response regulator
MPPTILIVDDHEAVRSALRNWLKEKFPSFRIMEMTSGEEAIAKIKEVSPHLIIMDFKLPGMDGINATRQIKRVVPSTHIVMFTIREGEIYIEEAMAAGASAFVTKRAMGTELIPTLNTLLAEIRPEDQKSDKKYIELVQRRKP